MSVVELRRRRQFSTSTTDEVPSSSLNKQHIVEFDKKDDMEDRRINDELFALIRETVENEDDGRVDEFIRRAFKGVALERWMSHVYGICLSLKRQSEFQIIPDYCGIFVCRLVERGKLSCYTVLTTLWHKVIPEQLGLSQQESYPNALLCLARFLREVFYEEIPEDIYNEETGVPCYVASTFKLNSKIEYLYCWWSKYINNPTSSSQQEETDYHNNVIEEKGIASESDDPDKGVNFSKKKFLERDCYLDILCEFLNLIRSEILFADALEKFIEFQTKPFRTILQLEYARLSSASNRCYVKMQTISCSYHEIKAASKLLRNVIDEPKLHPQLFHVPWYIPAKSTCKFRTARELEKREILKINLYYFSRILSNFSSILSNLAAAGVLTADDVDSIETHETPLEKSVIMFTKLVVKDPENFPLVVDAMKQTNNIEIVGILETDIEQLEKTDTEAKLLEEPASSARSPSLVEEACEGATCLPSPTKSARLDVWSCQHCTFDNCQDLTYCEQCCRSRHGTMDEHDVVYQCQICTLINPPGASRCEVCESPLFDDSTT